MRNLALGFAGISLLLVSASSCKKSATSPRTCTADSECVIACESRASCCHDPYCEGAQHTDDARDIREENAKRCTPADQKNCPVIGSRVEPNYRVVAKCVNAACVAEKLPK